MKIWIRVGMEADITVEELENLRNGDEETMKKIIQKAEIAEKPMCRIVIIMKVYMKTERII